MGYTLRFITPDDPEFADAAALRYETLHKPLRLPADRDWDDRDPETRHLVAVRDRGVVGYGRLILSRPGAQIRHLAVASSERGRGLGRTIVEGLTERAQKEGRAFVWLNARFTALGFWRALGFSENEEPLIEAEDSHLPHKRMTLNLRR